MKSLCNNIKNLLLQTYVLCSTSNLLLKAEVCNGATNLNIRLIVQILTYRVKSHV